MLKPTLYRSVFCFPAFDVRCFLFKFTEITILMGMDTVTAQLVFGIIVIVIAIGLIYWINRRKFYRRNGMGAEGFSSFEASVFTRFIERVGKWIAYALIIVGIVCIWTYNQMKKDRQEVKTEQPARR